MKLKNKQVLPCLQYEVMNIELAITIILWSRLDSVEFCHNAHPNSLIE